MANFILLNVSLIILFVYSFKKIRHGLHMLQLEYYKNDRYLNWIDKNRKQTFSTRDLLLFISAVILLINLKIGLIINLIICILLYISRNTYKEKKALVVTGRIKRMYVTEIFIYIILLLFVNINIYVLLLIDLYVVFAYHIVIELNILNVPIEKAMREKFTRMAKKKLEQMKNMKIIGVTGSYGKTSMKYILTTLLSQKYNVLKTPKSFNTKMGIVRTINENLKSTDQIFVCEMGADEVGEIKELCDFVHPNVGIITSIGPQHLQTFGSLENIKKTKFELIDSLPKDGLAFLNYENDYIRSVKVEKNLITYGLSNTNDYYAKEINIGEFGSDFVIHTRSNEEIKVNTKLLGEHNIINIVGAVAIAKELGLTNEQLQLGIKLIKPVEHRLELVQYPNGVIIIDDAYNSNTEGAEMAVNVLGNFKNKNKILVTPGIVELGDKLYEYNKKFGKQAASNCDFAILVGEKQAKPIYDGLIEEKFSEKNIFIVKNFDEAKKKMDELTNNNTVILLENDLTDNYL